MITEKQKLKDNSNHSEKLVDFDKIWTIVIKNWIVLKGDKVRLVPLMMFPLLMLLVFGYTSGNVPQDIPAAIVDYDGTTLSHELVSQIYSNQLYSVDYQVGSQEEGKSLIDRGVVKVLFIIPYGFEEAVKTNQPTTLSVIADESDPTIAQIVKASTQVFVGQVSNNFTAKRLAQISQKSLLAAQQIDSVSQTLNGISNQTPTTTNSLFNQKYNSSNNILLISNASLKQSYEKAQNSVGWLPNPSDLLNTPTTNDSDFLASLFRQQSKELVKEQADAIGGQLAANQTLQANNNTLYSIGQGWYLQNQAIASNISVSVQTLNTAKETLEEVSSSANTAQAPISFDPLDPYGHGRPGIDFLLPSILALIIFQGAAAGLGRAIAGERQDGSLTRVFLTPTSNLTIILGTQLFYMMFEIIRSSLIIFLAILLFGVTISGNILNIIVVIALFSFGATGVGMVLSVLTKSQEQYMAVSMLVTFPLIFLAGVFLPIQTMPKFLQGIAQVIPITYAADAFRGIMVKGFDLTMLVPDLIYLIAFGCIMFIITLLLFKRELI